MNSLFQARVMLIGCTCLACRLGLAQDAPSGLQSTTPKPKPAPVQLEQIVVVGKLNAAQNRISPTLGATVYEVDSTQIQAESQGENAPLNHVLLRLPGVSQDSAASGLIHVRDEHANVQYRVNDALIPEGITGFSTEFDSRFIDRFDLITGALPAQYGFRTAGIVDIHTQSGEFDQGGDASMYGGSYDTIRPSFEYGGHSGKLNYFYSGSYDQNSLGIENPTSGTTAIHDNTEQARGFGYLSYVLDDSSRLTLMLSGAGNDFQVPNNPGQSVGNDPAGSPLVIPGVSSFDSSKLNETQTEQNDYAVLSYQKSAADLDFQLSGFSRYSDVLFHPDVTGDLYFNGVAGCIDRSVFSNGAQLDSSYRLNDDHMLRFGFLLDAESGHENDQSTVLPTDASGSELPGAVPFQINDNNYKTAYFYGIYLQDEWRVNKAWTVNFGGRLDFYDGFVTENQLSPRINTTYEIDKDTVIHAGYAQYFTPPPYEYISPQTVSQFANTTAAPSVLQNDPAKAERSNYFDAGLTHKFLPEFQMGLDGYYKSAKDQLDDGQFGAAPILTSFNYAHGQIYGTEVTGTYTKQGFQAYANFAWEHATGNQVVSGQSAFGQDDLNYINTHNIFLDHDQRFTGSFGASYAVNESRPYIDVIYGSGLRNGFANTTHLPDYDTVNLGIEQGFGFLGSKDLKARFDIVNVFDQVYELRDGSGIGVGAPQYGARRGFFAGLSYSF